MTTPSRSLFSPGVPRPAPAAAAVLPVPVIKLMAHLKVASLQDLARCSAATISAATAELKMLAPDTAAIDIALATASTPPAGSDVGALASAVEMQRLSRIFRWMPAEEAAVRQLRRFASDFAEGEKPAFDALRAEYAARAKAGSLGALETLVGQYLLYAPDHAYSAFFLMSLLLRVPATQRVALHNWAVAQEMPRATKEAYGDAIAALATPLFPHCSALEACNTKLLESTPPSGGAPDGAGWLAVSQAASGAYGVDTAPLDSAIATELEGLRRQVRELSERVASAPPAPRRGRGQQYYQQQHQQHQSYHQYDNQRQNFGGRGGRGGRGYGIRGGDQGDPILDALFDFNSTAPPPPPAVSTPPAPPSQPATKAAAKPPAPAPPSGRF